MRARARQTFFLAVIVLGLWYILQESVPLSLPVPNLDHILHGAQSTDGWGRTLTEILAKTDPGVGQLGRRSSAGAIGYKENQDAARKRPDLVLMNDAAVTKAKTAHEKFISLAANMTLPYVPGTRGIVSTVGMDNVPVFILSLRMLRRTGSTLPVELFVRSDEEHGEYLCDELLPSLNARCVILDDFVPKSFTLEKYQYKIFSLLFSSFEEVLLLDADNFPIVSPEYLFDDYLFRSVGLVLWPDFWISTASPKFYQIQSTPEPSTAVRASTESGQVLVSKRTHSLALLVATYYNYYGPSCYYPLLTQGGPGEGDKETFLAGAVAVNATFYQVSALPGILGYTDGGKTHGVAMLQHDPVSDSQGSTSSKPFTVHANFPKLEPNSLFGSDSPIISSKNSGQHHRLWDNTTHMNMIFGRDVEREIWEEIRYISCDLGGVFAHWKAKQSHGRAKGTCDQVDDHIYSLDRAGFPGVPF